MAKVMRVVKGSTRIVLIFKKIVIKLPVIHLLRAYKSLRIMAKNGILVSYLKQPIKNSHLKKLLFGGVIINWEEFVFYRRSQSVFLAPTYFSLFGFLNIQKKGEIAEIKVVDLWWQLLYLTNDEACVDTHSFSNPSNFCIVDGKLKMVDYGDAKVYAVINKYGDKIFNDFNLNLISPWSDNTTTG